MRYLSATLPRESPGDTTEDSGKSSVRRLVFSVDKTVPESSSYGPLPVVGVTGAGSNAEANASETFTRPHVGASEPIGFPNASTDMLCFAATGTTMLANRS